MRRAEKDDGSFGGGHWRLPCLALMLLALGAPGNAPAQQLQPADRGEDQGEGRHGSRHTTYRVINLGPGTIATYPHINARGQVAYSLIAGGGIAGFFYDGAAVRNIGSLGGGIAYVNDLNEAGQIAGTSLNEQRIENAFVWSAAGGMLDIRAQPDRGRSYGMAINNRGVVTGSAGDPARLFRWSAASGVEDLGVLPALPGPATGQALNDAGLIAGVVTIEEETTHALVWTRGGGVVDINTLPSVESSPVAVGAGGEVAGNRFPSFDDGGDRPFLWTAATGMVDLGIGRGSSAWVNAMTPGLHIAGGIAYPEGRHRAMSWTPSGGMRELGTFGGRTSVARNLNTRGQLVGFAEDTDGAMRAFVWSANGGMRDLNRALRHAPPGLVLDHAMAINDSGAIVATSNAGLVLLKPDHGGRSGHTVGPLVAPDRVKAGAPLAASVAFVDGDRVGTRSVDWSWGDGSGGAARGIVEREGASHARASHSFAAPGRYTVSATVVDREGRSTTVSREVEVTVDDGASASP